jgi:2-dehydropantoate 2-reductase
MKKISSVMIAGAGAVGAMLADKIAQKGGYDLSVFAEGERLIRYKKNGIIINGKTNHFKLSGDIAPFAADIIIFACKSYSLESLIAGVRPFTGQQTIMLSLINGITSEHLIGAAYGAERLPLAMVNGTDAQHKDNSINYDLTGHIHFGDAADKDTERDNLIAAFLEDIHFPFVYHKQGMKRMLWHKFMMNVGLNQTSALLRLPYAAFKKKSEQGVDEAKKIMECAMRELIAISVKEGINLDEGNIEECYKTFEGLSDKRYTSMCQDVMAQHRLETELFGEAVCALGRKYGIATPVNEMLTLALRAIEKTYGRF